MGQKTFKKQQQTNAALAKMVKELSVVLAQLIKKLQEKGVI